MCLVVLGSPPNRHMPQTPSCFKNTGYHSIAALCQGQGAPSSTCLPPTRRSRNCNFGVHQPPINPQTTPKGPPPTPLHSQPKLFTAAMGHLSFDLRASRARPRFKISRRNEFFTISGNRGAAKANELLPTPRPISTTYQHSLSTTQPSLGTRTARAATERPNQQICRVADHQARPVPELPWGEPGLDCGRFLRLDMPQNLHEELFPAHMAMK